MDTTNMDGTCMHSVSTSRSSSSRSARVLASCASSSATRFATAMLRRALGLLRTVLTRLVPPGLCVLRLLLGGSAGAQATGTLGCRIAWCTAHYARLQVRPIPTAAVAQLSGLTEVPRPHCRRFRRPAAAYGHDGVTAAVALGRWADLHRFSGG